MTEDGIGRLVRECEERCAALAQLTAQVTAYRNRLDEKNRFAGAPCTTRCMHVPSCVGMHGSDCHHRRRAETQRQKLQTLQKARNNAYRQGSVHPGCWQLAINALMPLKTQADTEVASARQALRDKELQCTTAIDTNATLLRRINVIHADDVLRYAIAACSTQVHAAPQHLLTKHTPRLNEAAAALNAVVAVFSAGVSDGAARPAVDVVTAALLPGALSHDGGDEGVARKIYIPHTMRYVYMYTCTTYTLHTMYSIFAKRASREPQHSLLITEHSES